MDDFLICGKENHPKYEQAKQALQAQFKFGKWCERKRTGSMWTKRTMWTVGWRRYPSPRNEQGRRRVLTSREVSSLRGALGMISWKASQTGPHHQAEVSLLLSEVPMATVKTLETVNKLVREVK